MSEFWVSKNRYFCFYCKIYITDDKASRSQHENGLKHKGAVDKYVRELYKKGEQEKKDKADEATQMAAINAAAYAATGTSAPSTSAPKKASRGPTSSDPYANYSDAQSLGLVDDATIAAFNAAQAQASGQTEGTVGTWQAVSRPQQSSAAASTSAHRLDDDEKPATFGAFSRERVAPLSDDLYDPGAAIVLKKRKKPKKEEVADQEAKKEEEEQKPKIRGFKLAAFAKSEGSSVPSPGPQVKMKEEQPTVKQEETLEMPRPSIGATQGDALTSPRGVKREREEEEARSENAPLFRPRPSRDAGRKAPRKLMSTSPSATMQMVASTTSDAVA